MNVLELFAGSRSIGKVAEKLGHNVFSVDIFPFEGIDLVKDVNELTTKDIPFVPDVIWASPPCTTYSILGLKYHRKNGVAISKAAQEADILLKNLISFIKRYNCIYYIENPRGALRSMSFMKDFEYVTVWYCKYGSKFAKPTDIFSNNIRSLFNANGWQPRPQCFNGNLNCHHDKQAHTYQKSKEKGLHKLGIRGSGNNYSRSIIPELLATEIIKASEIKINSKF